LGKDKKKLSILGQVRWENFSSFFFVFGKGVGKNKCAEMCSWLFSMCGNVWPLGDVAD